VVWRGAPLSVTYFLGIRHEDLPCSPSLNGLFFSRYGFAGSTIETNATRQRHPGHQLRFGGQQKIGVGLEIMEMIDD
jgi:hypothetical protein